MKITLISLGVCAGDLTKRGEEELKKGDIIIARTANTKSFESLKNYKVQTFDELFLSCRSFDSLNKRIANTVLNMAKTANVCYCVDGGVCEDEGCRIILSKGKNVQVVEGVTKSGYIASKIGFKRGQYAAVSAYNVHNLKSCSAAAVYDIDGDFIASKVKEKLSDLFGEESECFFIRGEEKRKIKVYEIDRQKTYDYSCAVGIEEKEFLQKNRYDYDDIISIVKLLRAPNGCPWDRVQTNESIKNNVIEEAYELADAIERGDDDGIEEEAGDILLQAAFHSVLKEEQGALKNADITTRLVKKLIFRHSHIFGKDKAGNSEEALSVWEKNKREEKGQEEFSQTLVAVPKNMPACMRAEKVGKRASKCGLDFATCGEAAKKLNEEVQELIEALQKGDKERILDESGDVLFSAVNLCRKAGVDCEESLHLSLNKFIKRFTVFEKLAKDNGEDIKKLDQDRQNYLWELAKNATKTN